MTFTRAYSASPLCSPTRSALLTGLSPARTGITTPNCHLPQVVLEATTGKKAPPDQKAIMAKMAGPTIAKWFNPTTGVVILNVAARKDFAVVLFKRRLWIKQIEVAGAASHETEHDSRRDAAAEPHGGGTI